MFTRQRFFLISSLPTGLPEVRSDLKIIMAILRQNTATRQGTLEGKMTKMRVNIITYRKYTAKVGQDNVNIGVVAIFRLANTSLLQVY